MLKLISSTPSELCNASTHVRENAICDWLDVTCSPENSFYEPLCDWFAIRGYAVRSSDSSSVLLSVGSGVLKLSKSFNHHRASASGSCIDHLRADGLWRDYVNLLGTVGHKVTRLDVAVDVWEDAPNVLSELCAVYSDGSYSFGRKSVRTKTIFERRETDNLESGTWYAGHRSSARVTARVYDKQLERLQYGIITPPLTRYELTFRKDYGCSLWDVLMPNSLFYSHSSGLLDPPSGGFDDWSSRGLVPWVSTPVDTDLTVEKFSKRVQYSPDLQYIVAMAARFGPQGKAIILREFERGLDNALDVSSCEGVAD